MGEARKRGSFEERKKAALERHAVDRAQRARSRPPERRSASLRHAALMALASAAGVLEVSPAERRDQQHQEEPYRE